MAEAVEFTDQEVNVFVLHARIWNDVAEEIWFVAERLIADHKRTSDHHASFQKCRDLQEGR